MTGRPTSYKPEYCDDVIEYGKNGKSVAWMAAEIGVHKDTLYEWAKVHTAFSDAFTLAKLYSQQWWEDAGQVGMEKSGFGGSVWSRSMAARFPDDWREIKGSEISAPGGKPLQIERIERVIIDTTDSDA